MKVPRNLSGGHFLSFLILMPDPQSHNLSRHQWKRKKKLNWRDSETVDQEGHEDEGRRRYTVVAGEPAVANGSYLRSPSKWLLRFINNRPLSHLFS